MNNDTTQSPHTLSRKKRTLIVAATLFMISVASGIVYYLYSINHQRLTGFNDLDFSQCTVEIGMFSTGEIYDLDPESTQFKEVVSSISGLVYRKSMPLGVLACGSNSIGLNIDLNDGRKYDITFYKLCVDVIYSKGDHQIRYISNIAENRDDIYQSALSLYLDLKNGSTGAEQ